MEYTAEVLDRTTGDLNVVSLGNWVTVSEYGEAKGLGPRQVRAVLSELGLLVEERETPKTGGRSVSRRRLSKDAIRDGLGKRHYPKGGYPFDVLSPKGQAWIDERWGRALAALKVQTTPLGEEAGARLAQFKLGRIGEDLTLQMEVYWLLDHYPDLTQAELCRITGGGKGAVSGYVKMYDAGQRELRARLAERRTYLRPGSLGLNQGFPLHRDGKTFPTGFVATASTAGTGRV